MDDESLRLRGKIFGASLDLLKEILTEQALEDKGDLTRPEAVSLVDGWFTKQLAGEDGGTAAKIALTMNFETESKIKTEPKDIKSEAKEKKITEVPVFKKEFKVSGQIDCKTGITYISLRRQIDTAISKNYSEADIIDAIIRAIPPTSGLRRYLEGKENPSLDTVKNILRAHYNEKTATELYNELGTLTQGQKETPTDFLMRALDLKQKVLLASKEATEDLKYSSELVENLFVRTVYTGLSNTVIRQEFQPVLNDPDLRDEDMIEKLNKIVSRETERLNKFSKIRVQELSVREDKQASGDREELKTLKAEIAELKELVKGKMTINNNDGKQKGMNACESCASKGLMKCGHCWKCGSSEHFKRGCRVQTGNGRRSHQGAQM